VAEDPDRSLEVGEYDRGPVVLGGTPPTYPRALQRAGIEGVVRVQAVVGLNGRAVVDRVVESAHPDFNATASQAVARWRFQPAEKNGLPVRSRIVVPVRFQLQ
jgi:protein TonB